MPFSSFTYLLAFLPVVVASHWYLRSRFPWPWPQVWLIAASLVFYTHAESSNLPLLAASVVTNWALGRAMMSQADTRRRKQLLCVGLVVNIVVLFLFKYIHFLLEAIARLHGPRLEAPQWEFPLGVSFFTLTQIMYLVDAYPRAPASPAARTLFRGLTKANSLFEHAAFVTLFPYVVSGPLVSARATVSQIRQPRDGKDGMSLLCRGLFIFSIGLAKKVVLADSFAPLADAGFASAFDGSALEAWICCLSALLNLYFDFSGYSDLALGSAWMLGIDIPQNFRAPLRASSISEFWQRWHISLSRFITDYLYTPLLRAFGRPTLVTSAVATILAMSIAALWHGPEWTFVAWGVSHGVALATHQTWRRHNLRMPDIAGWALTMLFLISTVVFLRAADLPSAGNMLRRLVAHENLLGLSTLKKVILVSPTIVARPLTIGLVAALFFKNSMDLAKAFKPSLRTALCAAALLLISAIYINSAPARQFIYFGF